MHLKRSFSVSVLTTEKNIGTTHNEEKTSGTQTELQKRDFQRSFNVQLMGDGEFKSFTGVTRQIFAFLLSKVKSATEKTHYAAEPMLELYLVKLKLNLTYIVAAGMFGINENTASTWFKKVCHILHNKLKRWIVWYDKPRVQARMPPRFKRLCPRCRVVIDATEIKTDRPSKQNKRIHLWSNYKHAYTIKFMIGIAPSGI